MSSPFLMRLSLTVLIGDSRSPSKALANPIFQSLVCTRGICVRWAIKKRYFFPTTPLGPGRLTTTLLLMRVSTDLQSMLTCTYDMFGYQRNLN